MPGALFSLSLFRARKKKGEPLGLPFADVGLFAFLPAGELVSGGLSGSPV